MVDMSSSIKIHSCWSIISVIATVTFLSVSQVLCSPFLLDDLDDIPIQTILSSKDRNALCNRDTPSTSEEFTMQAKFCSAKAALKCEIGGSQNCLRDKQSFKATSKIDSKSLECLVDGNTDDLAIRFIIDAKLLKSQNQLGSRGMGGDESEIQRGKCTLGYTCIDDETDATKKYLQDVKVDCYSFRYDENDKFMNGTDDQFHMKWLAPPKYQGPIVFGVMVKVSFSEFMADVKTSKLRFRADAE